MKLKTLVVAVIVAATLCAPGRSEAAGTAEASQLLLPAVGLVAGLIGGKIMGASMGIAAFGTAISGKVPGAIIGGLLSAALAAQVAAPTMSLAEVLLVGVAVIRLAVQLGDVTWQDLRDTAITLWQQAGSVVRWVADTIRDLLETEAHAEERRDWFSAPEWPHDRFPGDPRTTVVEFRELANPGGLVPDLTPGTEIWKGQPVR
ncbi:MAG: hypothetical protein F4018_08545 [Acidobacteria bacterium]|nr:hypothetical protein [Acidobacteriota bacterium]MYH28660.1 hypothetical protein [Acidobacteriota bacterium]MYK88377.1 hypothetical protein [Acidobacteriota bacterium]